MGCSMSCMHPVLHAVPSRWFQRSVPSATPTLDEPMSATEPDWTRERYHTFWEPSRQLIAALRDYARARERGGALSRFESKLAVARHRFWSVVCGADIPLNCFQLGGGLLLPHPQGVVIHPNAELGPNCTLFQHVTIGTGPKPGAPKLGGHVDVGAGAQILGGVVIGDHAVVGANAVVVDDVPPHALAVGVPATVRARGRKGVSAGAAPSGPRAGCESSADAEP